jgi:putative transposase
VLVHVPTATGVNTNGLATFLGVDVNAAADGASWLAFFRSPGVPGLSDEPLVTSGAPV